MTARKRFRQFHRRNPAVLKRLIRTCRKLKAQGINRFGIEGVFWYVRLSRLMTTGRPYKLSNNFKPYYARLIMDRATDLEGFFKIKGLRDIGQQKKRK